jgi:triosephosphate isomerase (TIM)
MPEKIVAGNWKMNTLPEQGLTLSESVLGALPEILGCKVILCPPFTHLDRVIRLLKGTSVLPGSQNVSAYKQGAYTGEVSADMLAAMGIQYSIVGHSERRQYFSERGDTLKNKLVRLKEVGIIPIFCVGETLEERESGQEGTVVLTQLNEALPETLENSTELVVAYEPVWAIGTGKTASPEQASEMHGVIRQDLIHRYGSSIGGEISILYGGSVKPDNAAELFSMDDIDGGLIGGAALNAADFISIIKAFK